MDESDFSSLKKDLQSTKHTGHEYLRITLSHFLIQWGITIFLFITFWKTIPLIRWTLLVLVPLGIFNLYQFYYQKKKFNQKLEGLDKLVEEIEEKKSYKE